MTENDELFDRRVRYEIYDACLRRGYPPKMVEIAGLLHAGQGEIRAASGRLAAGRVIVLQRESGEILMANPFSAVPTPFLVETANYNCFGSCIWEALGIPAMLGQDVRIKCSCADCGSAIELRVENGAVAGDPPLLHFAVPALHWWDDIVFT